MPHDISLITTIAAGLGFALILGFLATKIGVPPLVGYIVAGIVAGPATPGFVADVQLTSQLAEIGIMRVTGDASEAEVLVQAHVARASLLVVATPDTVKVRKIVEIARTLNPRIEILIRTHSDEEAALLRQERLGKVFMGEHELAQSMTREVLSRLQLTPEREVVSP